MRVTPIDKKIVPDGFYTITYATTAEENKFSTRSLSAQEIKDFINAYNGDTSSADFSQFVKKYGMYGIPGWEKDKTATKEKANKFILESIRDLQQLIENEEIGPFEAYQRYMYYYDAIPDTSTYFDDLTELGMALESTYPEVFEIAFLEAEKQKRAEKQMMAAENDFTTIFTSPTK
jgi:hypothetical protein